MLSAEDNSLLELRKFVAPEYIFGLNARLLAVQYLHKLGAKKCVIVTDNVIKKTTLFLELEKSLIDSGVDFCVFSNVSPNPRAKQVKEGAEYYLDNTCNSIIALGGGSVIDCAKGIGIVVSHNKDIREFEGVDKLYKPIPPLICIPTTAGSSADVSQFAIINNSEQKYKMAIISKALIADIALVDPQCLVSMPPDLTANTGMDALSHAIEAFVSNASSPITNLYSLKAIEIIHNSLPLSVKNPDDIVLRGKMMLASLYAGLAFSNASLGVVHSMAHSLGGYLDLPHGECNSILLPHVVNFNFHSVPDKFTQIAEIFGIKTNAIPLDEIKINLVETLFQFTKNLGIDPHLRNKGVDELVIEQLSQKAMNDPCNATNPIPPNFIDIKTIYNAAL